jgi:threonine/homoserine/homoserine lactone efflux protein
MLFYIVQIILISLSGVMAPGPVTAVTIASGSKYRHAGSLLACGHAVVEMPLIAVIAAGMGGVFEHRNAQVAIGIAGGIVLILLGLLEFRAIPEGVAQTPRHSNPFTAGIILSAANPYFLVWWATVGLLLINQARKFGIWAIGLFAIVHWCCDLAWLEILSLASFKGTQLIGEKFNRIVPRLCGGLVIAFGVYFLLKAACLK